MEKIREQEKNNNFDHVYLLYGNEQQVVKIYRNKILKGLLGTDSLEELKQDMNFSLFVGTPFDMDSAVSLALSYPFMAEKRVILLENTKSFSKDAKALVECVANLPETTYMIFTEQAVTDKKGLYAIIKEKGHVVEINEQPAGFVENWLVRQFTEANKRISRAAVDLLIERVGLDMMRLSNEAQKLIAYVGDEQDVMADDVAALVSEDPQEQVFKMIDAMADKNIDKAMKLYYDMLELKVSPQNILRLVERQMRILYQVKDMRQKGFATSAIGDAVKEINVKFVNKYVTQAGKFTMKEIMDCLKDCVDLNLQSRTGALTDRMAVELIIVRYSGKGQK